MSDDQKPGTTVVPTNGNHVAEAPDDFLTRMAMNPAIDADKLKTLAETWIITQEKQREWEKADRADAARIAFYAALPAMQRALPVLDKDTPNQEGKGKYTDYGDLWEACYQIWTAHGFSVSFDTVPTGTELIRLKCIVRHAAGHEEEYFAPDTPADTMGPQGTANKTVIQGQQASITYVQRGLLCRAIGIAMRREEIDGNASSQDDDGGRQRSQSLERRDQVKREQPPRQPDTTVAPPPRDWKQRLARGERAEVDRLKAAFASEPTAEKLEELVQIVREHVDKAPKPAQVEIAAALGAARKRLAQKVATPPPGFDFPVFDANGETDGELTVDPARWARLMLKEWERTPGFERPNLLHHNADALAAARTYPAVGPLLVDLQEPASVVGRMMDNFDRGEAQRRAEEDDGDVVPDWMKEPAPPPAQDEDAVWVDAQVTKIQKITADANGRKDFDRLVSEIRPQIAKLRTSKPPLFNRINAEFTAKHNELPAAAA